MSDIIQLLPDSVANQIAAGEVIQRPASVIKELVENAVDAEARHINVIVVDAGRTSIQVIDDGKGMSETDARLAFERHATSKIRQADDLFHLQTMGFRGEALASIAAVAQVELRTRMADDDIGTQINSTGSRVVGQEPVACPVGSSFTVSNLFFNVPARRKFLKSNSTELSNIISAFERIALVYPDIAFTLHSNGTEIFNLRAANLHQRICDICGKRLSQELLPLEVSTSMCKIHGFVGKPEAAKKKAQDFFFVNGRYMKHAYFHKAVANAYERLVPQGMLPPYFIYFDVDPNDIDVNIHPVKTEIKFENEQPIWQILSAAVKDAIGKFCEIPSIDFDVEGRPDIPPFSPDAPARQPQPQYNPEYNPFKRSSVQSDWQKLYEGAEKSIPTDLSPSEETLFPEGEVSLIAEKSPIHYQYKGRYIMTAVKSGLMIIDQHRADVRIRYERYLQLCETRKWTTQRLLFPELLQLDARQELTFQQISDELQAMGFQFSDLGQQSHSILGVPAGIDTPQPAEMVREMIAGAEAEGRVASNIQQRLALSLARQMAIPYGQVLGNDEMEELVNQLFGCSNVNYSPDGKAVLCILPQTEIEQLMG